MWIHVAENGRSFELECWGDTTVDLVKACLVEHTGIAVANQILMCGAARLDSQRTLAHYDLPDGSRREDARPVVLYNKQRLHADAPPPPPEEVERYDPHLPSPLSATTGHPLDDSPDPALKVLPYYESQFTYHLHKGNAILAASTARLEACKRLLREIQVQEIALDTGRKSVQQYHYDRAVDPQFNEFINAYNRQYDQHAEILRNLDRDLRRLKACKLHPALRSEGRTTLLDCLDEAGVRGLAGDCATSLRQLYAKVTERKSSLADLQRKVQELLKLQPVVDVRALEAQIEEYSSLLVEQSSIRQTLSKDVNTIKNFVDERLNSQYSSQRSHDGASNRNYIRPHDAVSAYRPMHEIHESKLLPRMTKLDSQFAQLLEHCVRCKNAMSLCVHTRMQGVAAVQASTKDIRLELFGYREAMNREEEMFQRLKRVRKVGLSYKACLAEVVRRKSSIKLYMGQGGQLAEKMARTRATEVARREAFQKNHGQFLPWELIQGMGLFGNPSQCVVNIAPFDTHLLDIGVADIDRYSPEHLKGLYRSELQTTGSGEEQQRGESRDNNDVDTEDDGSNDEIAGTSRLEVENTYLKSQLAAAVAIICSMDPEMEVEDAGQGKEPADSVDNSLGSSRLALRKTTEALRLKDEYAKLLKKELATKEDQCLSYEKRIKELEVCNQHLYIENLKPFPQEQVRPVAGGDGADSGVSEVTGPGRMGTAPEPMDEGVCSEVECGQRQLGPSSTVAPCTPSEQTGRVWEGDATMCDASAAGLAVDAAMVDCQKENATSSGNWVSDRCTGTAEQVYVGRCPELLVPEFTGETPECGASSEAPVSPAVERLTEAATDAPVPASEKDDQLASLVTALAEKTRQCELAEARAKSAAEAAERLHAELERTTAHVNECQENCAHLENRLHDALQEARTHRCAAERRAAEYQSLRASSVRLCGLMERLKNCISAPGGANAFAESLRALAISVSSISDPGDDAAEFRASIRVLADKVGTLAQQRAELLEHCNIAESAQTVLTKDLEEKSELLKNFYAKRKAEKQASKEKICFTRFNVNELAVFMPNADGHYEAINVNCPNYYLSDESIALFLEHPPNSQQYIVGQIVHIDRNVARLSPDGGSPPSGNGSGSEAITGGGSKCRTNPYGLPVGTEYCVVTVAMVPDFTRALSF